MEWISVDERFPEPGSYLVFTSDGKRKGGISRKKYMASGWTMKRDERALGQKVTHWMPLPPPPEAGE